MQNEPHPVLEMSAVWRPTSACLTTSPVCVTRAVPTSRTEYACKAGLTNEVQRRAKRVRCNAGLGCWCPSAVCSLRGPGASQLPKSPAYFEVRMIGVRRTWMEGADAGATNLEPVPLREELWSSARRGCEIGLRRAAGACGFELGFRDLRGIPTVPTHRP